MDIASISLQAGRDVNIGEKITTESLFPWRDYDEVKKVFELSDNIIRGMMLNVRVDKFTVLKVPADIDKKVGQQPLIGLWMLLSFKSLRKEMTCIDPVKIDEWLTVTITSDLQNEAGTTS